MIIFSLSMLAGLVVGFLSGHALPWYLSGAAGWALAATAAMAGFATRPEAVIRYESAAPWILPGGEPECAAERILLLRMAKHRRRTRSAVWGLMFGCFAGAASIDAAQAAAAAAGIPCPLYPAPALAATMAILLALNVATIEAWDDERPLRLAIGLYLFAVAAAGITAAHGWL